jgi:hypothetical protein
MRAPSLAFFCLLTFACSKSEPPDMGEEGPTMGDGDELTAPKACREITQQATCEAQGCEWVDCPPNADCQYLCEDAGQTPDGKTACEAKGGVWTECRPNEDCSFRCVLEPGESADAGAEAAQPDAGHPSGPSDACVKYDDGTSCAEAGCDWRMCPPEQGGGYHCVDATRCQPWDRETCEAEEGCVWKECPPNADCAWQCRDPRIDEC